MVSGPLVAGVGWLLAWDDAGRGTLLALGAGALLGATALATALGPHRSPGRLAGAAACALAGTLLVLYARIYRTSCGDPWEPLTAFALVCLAYAWAARLPALGGAAAVAAQLAVLSGWHDLHPVLDDAWAPFVHTWALAHAVGVPALALVPGGRAAGRAASLLGVGVPALAVVVAALLPSVHDELGDAALLALVALVAGILGVVRVCVARLRHRARPRDAGAPERRVARAVVAWLTTLGVLGGVGWHVARLEETVARGRIVLVPISPTDPCGLSRESLEALDYRLSSPVPGAVEVGTLAFLLDPRGVVVGDRYVTGPPGRGEVRVPYRIVNGAHRIAPTFLLVEPGGGTCADARFAELRVGRDGRTILAGFVREDLTPMGTRPRIW